MGEFHYQGHRIEYDAYGEGDRAVVLAHGLLMNRRMYGRLGPALAERGNRAICVDLLGHGRSDRPEDLRLYSMPLFARQMEALLDHLGLDTAVVGGTSLGANVALELVTRRPERVRGLLIEMPVLDDALSGVAATFAPVMSACGWVGRCWRSSPASPRRSPAPTTSSTSGSTGSVRAPVLL